MTKHYEVKIEDGCIGCACCELICDAVFEVNHEDISVANQSKVMDNLSDVEEAVDACPVGVIVLEEV